MTLTKVMMGRWGEKGWMDWGSEGGSWISSGHTWLITWPEELPPGETLWPTQWSDLCRMTGCECVSVRLCVWFVNMGPLHVQDLRHLECSQTHKTTTHSSIHHSCIHSGTEELTAGLNERVTVSVICSHTHKGLFYNSCVDLHFIPIPRPNLNP